VHVKTIRVALATAAAVVGAVSAIVVLRSDRDESPITPPATAAALASSVTPARSEPSVTRPTFPPQAKTINHGDRVWAVYLVISPDYRDPRHLAAQRELARVGYREFAKTHGYAGGLDCDHGARSNLAEAGIYLDPAVDYSATAVYFDTEAAAFGFVDAFEPGVVGTVPVKYMCAD
jgi:hypothetical protein